MALSSDESRLTFFGLLSVLEGCPSTCDRARSTSIDGRVAIGLDSPALSFAGNEGDGNGEAGDGEEVNRMGFSSFRISGSSLSLNWYRTHEVKTAF